MFMDRVDELSAFHAEHGRYPEPAEGALGNWTYLVRKDKSSTPDSEVAVWKIQALEALSEWSWDGYRESRRSPFIQKLTDWYLSVGGIADPSTGISEQRELAEWMHRNRDRYHSGAMEKSRVEELEVVPFWTWNSRNSTLDPKRSLVERELSWMIDNSLDVRARSGGVTGYSGQRHQCDLVIEDHKIIVEHDGRLWHAERDDEDNDKTFDLEKAGWTVIRIREDPLKPIAGVTVSISTGASMTEALEAIREKFTELGVQSHDIDLEALGKVPGGRLPYYDDWYSSMEAFQQYIDEGGSPVPIATAETGEFKVGQWVYVQRRKLKRGQLSESKKMLLEAIPGWQWELKPHVRLGWDTTYERLIEYQKANGRIPAAKFRYEDGLKLGSWAAYQRYDRRKGRLSDERIRMLDAVPGWYW